MGARWPQEEWKPNMAELEVSVVIDERKMMLKSRAISLQLMDFKHDIYLLDVFTSFMERKFPKQKQVFSEYNEF